MNPLTENNPYLPQSLTKLNVFCTIGNTKWKAINVVLVVETKEQCVRIQPALKF
jgi:hypothetical protein